MLGAILGDMIGSIYEWKNIKSTEFPLFQENCRPTDDSVMSIAVADGLMRAWGEKDDVVKVSIIESMQYYGKRYPHAGYGGSFRRWLRSYDPQPYNSWGNGSAMRVSSVGWLFDRLEDVLHFAKLSAEVTHNHPEGIKGAQAIATAVYMARNGYHRSEIQSFMKREFQYDLNFTLDEIRPTYAFDVSCQGSVPQAIKAFLESKDYESAVRLAISIGGDSDTIACMAGAIAEAYYGIPTDMKESGMLHLDGFLKRKLANYQQFYEKIHRKKSDIMYDVASWKAGVLGAVVGDALGVPAEFKSRDVFKADPVTDMEAYGTHHQPAGTWSDDSSMLLATLDSLLQCGGIDYADMMRRFVAWMQDGKYTPFGTVFDHGIATANALRRFSKDIDPLLCGGMGEHDNGNGSLMRILPICLYFYDRRTKICTSDDEAIQAIHNVSALTHGHIRSQMACGIYYFCVRAMLEQEGILRQRLQKGMDEAFRYYQRDLRNMQELSHYDMLRDLDRLAMAPDSEISSSGYVVHTLIASIWCLLQTDNYADCVLLAVNLGSDTDTTAEVAGGLAGLYYGMEGIPQKWLDVIQRLAWIEDFFRF